MCVLVMFASARHLFSPGILALPTALHPHTCSPVDPTIQRLSLSPIVVRPSVVQQHKFRIPFHTAVKYVVRLAAETSSQSATASRRTRNNHQSTSPSSTIITKLLLWVVQTKSITMAKLSFLLSLFIAAVLAFNAQAFAPQPINGEFVDSSLLWRRHVRQSQLMAHHSSFLKVLLSATGRIMQFVSPSVAHTSIDLCSCLFRENIHSLIDCSHLMCSFFFPFPAPPLYQTKNNTSCPPIHRIERQNQGYCW